MTDNIVQLHPQRPRTFGDWLSLDTFANLIAVFGLPGRDKVVSQVPVLELLDTNSLEALYRGDWVSRKIVDIPASDSTRAWRTWNATKQQVKALEETERTFGIQRKLLSALIKARLYGGSAIIVGVGGGQEDMRLKVSSGQIGSLSMFSAISTLKSASASFHTSIVQLVCASKAAWRSGRQALKSPRIGTGHNSTPPSGQVMVVIIVTRRNEWRFHVFHHS